MVHELDVLQVVKKYESLSPHRTGGVGNTNVLTWLNQYLELTGWNITNHKFEYKHYDSILKSNNLSFKGMLLYYSVIGKGKLKKPLFYSISDYNEIENGTQLEDQNIDILISELTKTAIANGNDCVIIESISKFGDLCAINSSVNLKINFPIILVDRETYIKFIKKNQLISYDASINERQTFNIIAKSYAQTEQSPLVITTPISGWFTCAGERGCGIAIALAVAKEISKYHPVDLVFANGHELGYQGAYEFVGDYKTTPKAVLHLGSCLANIDSEMISICYSKNIKNISIELHKLGIIPQAPINNRLEVCWVGESKCWASKNVPMLSIAGEHPYFHTSADVMQSVTNEKLLVDYVKYIIKAALALMDT